MTKKAIREAVKNAPRFILYIDYKAASDKSIEYKALSAKDVISAMDEAEQYKNSEVYFMSIAESTDNVTENEELIYVDKLCTRSTSEGWYHSDKTHGENVCSYTYGLEFKYLAFQRILEYA